MPEIDMHQDYQEVIHRQQEALKDVYDELRKVKKKSDTRKRHLRDLNKKIEMYIALADAAISDAARWKLEYETLKEKFNGLKQN